jgi:hypothetical protein
MKAILEFDLDERFDMLAHKRCVNATNAYIALFKIREQLLSMEDVPHITEMLETIDEYVDLNDLP